MKPQLLEKTEESYLTEMLIMADWRHVEVHFVLLKLKVEAADR